MEKGKLFLKNIIFILFFLTAGNIHGQTLTVDSTKITVVKVDSVVVHSPKKAAIYSAILPGLGQAYNKKYWKIPIVYGGLGTIGYFIGWNNRRYKTYKKAYSDLTDTDENTNSYLDLEASKYYNLDDPTSYANFKNGLYKQQNSDRRNRDLTIIGMAAFYGLNIIDANVDAHFFDFDISEDLTMKWIPAMNSLDNQLVYGFNCTFNF